MSYFYKFFIIATIIALFVDVQAGTIYVTPTGSASNTGASYSSPLDILSAFANAKAGDNVLLQPGTYSIPYVAGRKNTITCDKAGTEQANISFEGDGGKAVIDFQFPVGAWVQSSYGIHLTGDYYYFKNITITRAGYQGVYLEGSHNTFENCVFYDNRNTGFEINKGGEYTLVLNCDAYYNYDPKKFGSMAEGFGPKQLQGPGNVFDGCRAWENSDDGFDLFDSPQKVIIRNSWTFRNGVDVWNIGASFDGNGNGFKVGGNYAAGQHELYNCVSFDHPSKGFDQNNNTGGVLIYNCTGYNNSAYNFSFGGTLTAGKNDFRNNISYSGSVNTANATEKNNTWNLGISMSSSDFESLDKSYATAARNADGTLPYVPFLVPKASSAAIDKGVDVGLPYTGSAPDLGYYELGSNSQYTLTVNQSAGGSISPQTADFAQDALVSLSATPAMGYVFAYWTGALSGSSSPASVSMDGDKTVSAVFMPAKEYTIDIAIDGIGMVAPDISGKHFEGTALDFSAVEYIGHAFTGWTGDYTATEKKAGIITAADMAITAHFEATALATVYEFEDGYFQSGIADAESSNTGFSGTGYVNTVNAAGNWTELTVYAPVAGSYSGEIFYAAISDRPATIAVNGNIQATLSNTNTASWTVWASQTLAFDLQEGANTLRFTATGTEGAPNLDKIAFTSNISTYSLTVHQPTGGSISPASGDYSGGTTVSVFATPDHGYAFSRWSGDLSGSENPIDITMDAHKTVSAVFTPLAITQTLEMAQGWNLISLYVEADDMAIQSLFPNAGAVKTADAFWSAAHAGYLNGFSEIEATKGYLVYANDAETVYIKGLPVAAETVSFRDGWNLVGSPLAVTKSLEDALGTVLDNIDVIKDFDEYWLPDGSGTMTEMKAGKAYFVR